LRFRLHRLLRHRPTRTPAARPGHAQGTQTPAPASGARARVQGTKAQTNCEPAAALARTSHAPRPRRLPRPPAAQGGPQLAPFLLPGCTIMFSAGALCSDKPTPVDKGCCPLGFSCTPDPTRPGGPATCVEKPAGRQTFARAAAAAEACSASVLPGGACGEAAQQDGGRNASRRRRRSGRLAAALRSGTHTSCPPVAPKGCLLCSPHNTLSNGQQTPLRAASTPPPLRRRVRPQPGLLLPRRLQLSGARRGLCSPRIHMSGRQLRAAALG
jgi:hypothetical protein